MAQLLFATSLVWDLLVWGLQPRLWTLVWSGDHAYQLRMCCTTSTPAVHDVVCRKFLFGNCFRQQMRSSVSLSCTCADAARCKGAHIRCGAEVGRMLRPPQLHTIACCHRCRTASDVSVASCQGKLLKFFQYLNALDRFCLDNGSNDFHGPATLCSVAWLWS